MEPTALIPEQSSGVEASDIIRIETALSRYPIHRLANKGTVSIDIRKKDDKGATTMFWTVDYGNRHGQPGPLAYKLDTLVINRKIDEAGRPTPKVLPLGSLHEIAQELGLDRNTAAVRKALLQNVGAIINAKITYKAVDKTERTLEAVFSRYSVVFTGENLPDGRKADCVYLILNQPYAEVMNAATRRPQDYEYLRDLPPAPQRFYEIVSYQMLPAIKYGQRAKLPYSEFCLYSTMTRYFEFDQVKKQMYKIHLPHVRAGYLAKIEYEVTIDDEGRPDWNMFYQPGETARRQQLVFEFSGSSSIRPLSKNASANKSAPAKSKNSAAIDIKTPPEAKDASGAKDASVLLALQLALPTVSEADLTPTGPAPQASLPKPNRSAPEAAHAEDLVRSFYQQRYGREQDPTEREIAEARQFLEGGPGWAHYLVEFAARKGKDKDSFPNDFGGVKKLVSQAHGPYAAQRKAADQARIKEARQSHENAHRSAYHAFLGQLLGGRLESSLPEAFSAFSKQEQDTFRFHQARATKSALSARLAESYYSGESRTQRLIKFIQENPQSGLPNFWQWDKSLNPAPFQAEEA